MYKEIIRENTLSELGIGDKPEIISFLDSKLKGLKQIKYKNSALWCKSENDIYMTQNIKNGYFYINYTKVWSVLKSQFGLSYIDIQSLTIWYVEATYNLENIITTHFPIH